MRNSQTIKGCESFTVGVGGGDASISFTTGTVIAASKKGSKIIP